MGSTLRHLWVFSLTFCAASCVVDRDGSDDDDDDDVQVADLTPLEWSMVGVWRGSRPDDRWNYMVFNADRTGCEWTRKGDDFAYRYDEVQFRDWALDADGLDEDFRMPLTYVGRGNGEVYDSDRYDLANDRILPTNLTEIPSYWVNIRIDCNDNGTDAIATDVQRWGSVGNGYVGEGDPSGTGNSATGPGTPGPGTTGPGTTGPGTTGPGTTGPGTTGPGTTGGDDSTDTASDTGYDPAPTGPRPP